MKSAPYRSRRFWLAPAALGGAALLAAIVADTRPASAFGGDIHERITRNAFPFITGGVLGTIVAGNLDEDESDEENLAERHAQNCRFRDSAAYINMRYRQVVDALREPRANDPNRAARLFGHILHGLHDFYSHSNWIPKPPQGLGIRNRRSWCSAATSPARRARLSRVRPRRPCGSAATRTRRSSRR